jgi:hypothetical protein
MLIDSNFEVSKCPVPSTHQRLRQAHMLWHQAAEAYHEPERFLTNINSLIQELRNVTFILQSEKARFRDFDAWYLPLQARLKAGKDAKWLIDTRNLVVKQGSLNGSSFATVSLLTSDQTEIARIPIADDLSSDELLRTEELQKRLPQMRAMVDPHEDPVLMIEKTWSTAELEGREVLAVLAELYGFLAEIVLSAHLHLGGLDCMALSDESCQKRHRDFPLLYDRSGLLRCMMHQATERTLFFRLSTLQRLKPARVNRALDIQPWQVLERYGFDEAERQPAFADLDPVTFAERVLFTSRKMLRKDRTHARIVWLRDSGGEWRQMTVIAENRAEKHLVMHQFADLVREVGCDAFIEVGEMWTGEAERFRTQISPDLEKYPGRGEALVVQLATRDGLERSYSTPFSRGKDGGIKLGDTDQLDIVRTYHLTPIRRVWADQ